MPVRNKKIPVTDLIAVLAFGIVFVCIFFAQRLGVGLVDEQFYHTIVKRLLQGDRLFVDEWHLSQMFSLLLILPCKLYLRIFGSAEGLIFAMRRLFFVYELLFGGYVYLRLRKYGLPALFFALALCVFFPYYTFTYYTFAINGIVLILVTLLAAEKKPKAPVLVLLGVVAAMTVLAEPILSVAYFLYTAQVFLLAILRRKRRAPAQMETEALTLRVWCYLTVGIVVVFSVFILWFFVSCGMSLRPLFRELPELFSGTEYSFDPAYELNNVTRFGIKYREIIRLFGYAPPVLAGLIDVSLLILRRAKPEFLHPQRRKKLLFALLCVLLTASYLYAWYEIYRNRIYSESHVDNILMHGGFLPVLLFGSGCHLLQKQPHRLSAPFIQTGIFASLLVDFSSDNCICYGGIVALLPAGLGFSALLSEFLRRPAEKEADGTVSRFGAAGIAGRIGICATAAVACICVLFWSGKTFVQCAVVPVVGSTRAEIAARPYLEKIERGPLGGIYTFGAMKDLCSAVAEDMTAAAEMGSGPIYVDSFCPMPYLCAEQKMGIYSSFYVEEDRPARVLRYWELHPEKTPEIIYIPYFEYMTVNYFDRRIVKHPGSSGEGAGQLIPLRTFFDKNARKEKIALFTSLFSCDITEGEAGYILHVTG